MKRLIGRELNLLPILLAPFILLAPIYITGRALFWGTPILQFMPWWDYAWRTLLAGHLPLWNPLVGMGAPLLANYQSALLYPPTWIYFVLYLLGGLKLMAWGQALMVAFHLAWAGLGMAYLARKLGLGILAQVVAGLSFGLSSYLIARSWFLSINATLAWLPWVLLSLTPDFEQKGTQLLPGRRFLLLVGCLAMQLLAGHAQICWYTLLLSVAWVTFWSIQAQANFAIRHRLLGLARHLVRMILAIILAFGIAAIQLLPTAEYLSQSQRATAVDYQLAVTYSFWPWRLLTFLAPALFGSPVSGDYWGYANYWEDAVYIGLLPLLLGISIIISTIFNRKSIISITPEEEKHSQSYSKIPRNTSNRSLVWFLSTICVIAIVLAFGKNTPIFPLLYFHVPTFNMFQAPTRWMIWCVFSLALLSGIGVERWWRPAGWGLYWTRLGTMGAIAIALGAGLAWYRMGDISPSFIKSTAILGFLGLGIGLLSLTSPPRNQENEKNNLNLRQVAHKDELLKNAPSAVWRKRLFQFKPPSPVEHSGERPYSLSNWQWAVALFIVLDLLVMNFGLVPAGDLDLYDPSPTSGLVKALTDGGRLFVSGDSEYFLKFVRFFRFDTFYPGEDWLNLRATHLSNSNMLEDIATIRNFDPLTPARFADWLEMLDEASPQGYSVMMKLMNVTVAETLSIDSPNGIQFEKETGRWFFWASCSRVVKSRNDARELILKGEIDLENEVILEGPVGTTNNVCLPQEIQTDKSSQRFLEILDAHNPNRIDIRAISDSPAWLVISDVWYPGWQARLDGKVVPIYRANYLFRAVHIPSGDHDLIFTYQPLSFWIGLTVTLISLVIFCSIIVKSYVS